MIRRPLLLSALLALTLVVAPARADETALQREANTHFQRAVQLYGEADYRAALVEFKRAYELAPHVTVLYNVGQSYYQLQSYAEALTTFERFLADGGTLHREDVEKTVAVLRTRVGRIDVVTATPGWDIAVDEEVLGKTPLARPLVVSIGRRRLVASKTGETTVTRNVEVGAGETVPVQLGVASPATTRPRGEDRAEVVGGPPAPRPSSAPLIVGWTVTGVLAAAATVTGIVALSKASTLRDAREEVPGNKQRLADDASTTTAFSVTTDVLVGTAVIAAGVSLYLTLTRPKAASMTGGLRTVGGTF